MFKVRLCGVADPLFWVRGKGKCRHLIGVCNDSPALPTCEGGSGYSSTVSLQIHNVVT